MGVGGEGHERTNEIRMHSWEVTRNKNSFGPSNICLPIRAFSFLKHIIFSCIHVGIIPGKRSTMSPEQGDLLNKLKHFNSGSKILDQQFLLFVVC